MESKTLRLMKKINNAFDKLIVRHPSILTLGHILVSMMIASMIMFIVHLIIISTNGQ